MELTPLQKYAEEVLAELPSVVRSLAILGGGALRAFFDGTVVKDYDLFFASNEDYETAIAEMFHSSTDGDWSYHGESGRTVEFKSPSGMTFNLIGFAFGTAEDHAEAFDFRCCQIVAWWNPIELLVDTYATEGAIEEATRRILTVVNNNGTDRTEERITRYSQVYGYVVNLEGFENVKRYLESKPVTQRGSY